MSTLINTNRVLLFVMLVALCMCSAQAQSGRRQNKTPPAAPVPTPTPEPTPTPKVEKKDDLGFIVAMDRRDSFSLYPFSYYDAVLVGCADRLKNGSSAQVDMAQKEMSRGEAIKKAKDEKVTYVVLLKLTGQTMSNSPNSNYDELEVEYVVFAPVTAKIVTSGRSYQNPNRKGPISTGPTGGGNIYREPMLRRTGEDAGERILEALHLTYRGVPHPQSSN